MNIIADLQLHSRYSRAVSPNMVLPVMSAVAKQKGIHLLATGDWMHPLWMNMLKAGLSEWSEGIYASRENSRGAKFLLSAEISSIYSQGGRGRRVHTLVFSPSIAVCLKINEELRHRGANLSSDGRPIVGLTCIQLAEIVFSVDERCLVIPAHAWTPWFSVFGSRGGFDSIAEAFGPYAEKIFAVETGLSSDPAMNWRVPELERRAVVSFSDAHSPAKLGREATVFKFKEEILRQSGSLHLARSTQDDTLALKSLASVSSRGQRGVFTYNDIYWAIGERFLGKNEGGWEIAETIEFYPEEGKYHWDGHRACGVVRSPEETKELGVTCPVCGRALTVGVEYRVDELARSEILRQSGSSRLARSTQDDSADLGSVSALSNNVRLIEKVDDKGVKRYYHPTDATRPPFVKLVPLLEILAEVAGVAVGAIKVKAEFERLVGQLGNEFRILLEASKDDLVRFGGERFAEAVMRVRSGEIVIEPGYDGVFGKVSIWPEDKQKTQDLQQISLFTSG